MRAKIHINVFIEDEIMENSLKVLKMEEIQLFYFLVSHTTHFPHKHLPLQSCQHIAYYNKNNIFMTGWKLA